MIQPKNTEEDTVSKSASTKQVSLRLACMITNPLKFVINARWTTLRLYL